MIGERNMIYVMLADGFEEIEALAFVDILRRSDIDVETVSIYNHKNVAGSHGIEVVADKMIGDTEGLVDGIVLPGGIPGTYNLQKCDKLIEMLAYHNENKKYVAAICAAPSVLGEMGILEGKKATCYPSFESKLIGSVFSNEKVVVDKNIITSRGAGTAHEFAFKIVELIKGKEASEQLRSAMLYD